VGVLDDPSRYYAPPQEDWSLGDIVIVPTAALWAASERRPNPYPQPAPPPDGSASVTYALWDDPEPFPMPSIECWLTPAVIVVDDCVLDKEFNAVVEQRIRAGAPAARAEAEARADPSLDPLVPVTPILPYGRARYLNLQAVRQAQPIGYFPIPEWPGQVDEGYLDFTRTVPVSRQLLWGPAAALSEPARRILRWKLAQFYAVRNLSVDAELVRAVGKVITAVRTVSDQKDRLVVDLELNDGEDELRLRQEPRRPEVPPGHQRGRPR
jgi:hypothetical protein